MGPRAWLMREGFHLWKKPFLAPLNCTAGEVFRWVHSPTAVEWVREGWGGHLCPTRTSAGLVSGLPGMMANRRHGWRNYCKVASPRSSCTQAGWLLFPPSLQHHLLWRFFFSFFLQLGHFNQSGNHVLRPQINGPWEGRRMVSAEPPWLPLQRNHLPASASLRSSFLGFSALLKAASFKSTSWQQVRTRQNQWLKLVFFMCKSPACQQGLGILFLLLKKIIYVFIYGCAGS